MPANPIKAISHWGPSSRVCQQPRLTITELLDFVCSVFRTVGVASYAQVLGEEGGREQNHGRINSSYFMPPSLECFIMGALRTHSSSRSFLDRLRYSTGDEARGTLHSWLSLSLASALLHLCMCGTCLCSVHVYTRLCMGRSTLDVKLVVFLCCFLLYFSRRGLSLNIDLTFSASLTS